MTEIFKIILTSCLTILGGVIVYTLGQIISKFIIEPIHEQKKIISEINDTLIFYANKFYIYKEKNEEAEEIVNKIRSLSTKLKSKTKLIPYYHCLEKYNFVLKNKSINDACSALIGLSNSVYVLKNQTVTQVESYRETISKELNIII